MGRILLALMNRRHSELTNWGLGHVSVRRSDSILDVGCGGGRTVSKLAARATEGRVVGIDFSETSVATARKTNRRWIEAGRVEIRHASVLDLPFQPNAFDLVTAVETHFWWPDLPAGMREIFRVVKPGGTLLIVAEIYDGGKFAGRIDRISAVTGMTILTVEGHRALFSDAGFADVQVVEEPGKGWICATGRKSS